MPSPPSYGCCTRENFVLKKHLLFQVNLSNSGLKNRSIKEYWLIFTVLKFPLGLQFSHNLTKFKIIKYISTIYIMTITCTYLQQLTQVSDVAHGPLVLIYVFIHKSKQEVTTVFLIYVFIQKSKQEVTAVFLIYVFIQKRKQEVTAVFLIYGKMANKRWKCNHF